MKDRVFIVWSGSSDVAFRVKEKLEEHHNYKCSIGGNADNSSEFSSVGDTVIQQIKDCNQAIVIFQNRTDGVVSNNLFFELGYVLAKYGPKKVHCVQRAGDKVVLPSDFDNSFVEMIDDAGHDDSIFADGIVKYFNGRQKMSITENKMYLINNRYMIHDKISCHYSDMGSKCSDYELAQYILFYMQAGHMFGDEQKIAKELLEFKSKHNFDCSSELELSINLCLSFYEMLGNIKAYDDTKEVYIDQDVFWKMKKDYDHYKDQVVDDDIGVFDEWINIFISEHLAYSYMLFLNNRSITEEMRTMLTNMVIDEVNVALKAIDILGQKTSLKENNDESGLISLLKAYMYRNMYIAKQHLGHPDYLEWLKKSHRERSSLKNIFSKGSIDTKLYDNFQMEYYLSLVEYLSYAKELGISDLEVMMSKSEIRNFIDQMKMDDNVGVYIKQIEHWCNQ